MTVVFDLNGTLTDVAAIGAVWNRPELGHDMLACAVESAMVDALTGRYRPFAEHLRGGIAVHAGRQALDRSREDEAAARASRLPAFPEAAEALEVLRGAGHDLAVLTNSGAEAGRATLEHAGLLDFFHVVLGVDAVRTYKPHPQTYAYAMEQLGRREDMTFVAAHGWDVTGAGRAGLRTMLITRYDERLSPALDEPDLIAGDLLDAARTLIAP